MRRVSLIFLIILLGLFVLLIGLKYALERPLPEGDPGPDAEALADRMLAAIGKAAWDTTGAIAWRFRGGHTYVWDRERNFVSVSWDNHRVLLAPDQGKGIAYRNGERVPDEQAWSLVGEATAFFNNDSFWFMAPAKVRDPGTLRQAVELENGSQGLLVTYQTGGNTPGDAYLWILDEKGLPQKWRMWVQIIPVGGLTFSWEGWTQLPTGAHIAQQHSLMGFHVPIMDIRAAAHFEGFTEQDPFSPLEAWLPSAP